MPCLLIFKDTVKVPKVCIIAAAAINAANVAGLNKEVLVTSGNDGSHMEGSKHYDDEALDFRTKHLTKDEKSAFINALRRRLGPDYDVVLESPGKSNEHAHVEWDPKG